MTSVRPEGVTGVYVCGDTGSSQDGQERASEDEDALRRVIDAADSLLRQCAGLVSSVTDEAYRAPSRVLIGGTIGKHVRHSLDHFRALFDAALNGSEVDYDHRRRDVPAEVDRTAALTQIAEARWNLQRAGEFVAGQDVRVRVMPSSDGRTVVLQSTLGRELAFATHHGVHHHAMIRAIAAEHGCRVDDEFGTAPSTVNHERAHTASGG